MPQIIVNGPFRYSAKSLASLLLISAKVALRRPFVGPLAPGWSLRFEIGNLFYRQQFEGAFALPDIREGRKYFDSLLVLAGGDCPVERHPTFADAPKGEWITPRKLKSDVTLLYLHGGGYAFYAAITHHFAGMLAAHLGARMFALDYRMTPEHPYPAQEEDALAAYRYLLAQGVDPKRLVVIGDSAGGHLTLMTLVALRQAGLPQPALAIGLSPWADIGDRGESLRANNRYDLLQSNRVLRFSDWLVKASGYSRERISAVSQDYAGVAPIYLQGGGREVLIDMIRDLARAVVEQGHEVMLDVWPEMTHEFHAHGLTRPESAEAIARLQAAIAYYAGGGPVFDVCARTENHHRPTRVAMTTV